MPAHTPEEKQLQCTPPKAKDPGTGRLTINVEVWYNSLPTMGCDVGAAIKNNLDKLWPGLARGSFPWDIYYMEEDVQLEDDELEDGNDYRVRVMLQFKPGKTSTPIKDEASRLCAIQSLCKSLLDTRNEQFAQIPILGRKCMALNWKPSTRTPLSSDDQRFGAAFCLQVLASNDCKTLFPKSQSSGGATRVPETKFFGPRQSMLLFEDFKILFKPQISHLQEIFPGEHINPVTGMTQNAEETVLYILKSCVSGSNDGPPVSGSGDLITAFPAHVYQDSTQLSTLDTATLESQLKELMELFKTNTMQATGGIKGLFQADIDTEKNSIDQGAVLNTMKSLNTVMQLTTPVYQSSKELQSRQSQKLWKMGLTAARDTGFAGAAALVGAEVGLPVALAAAETALAEAGFSAAAAMIAEMGFASAGSGTMTIASGAAAAGSFGVLALAVLIPAAIAMVKVWKEKKRSENVSKATLEAGAYSHALWLFMIVYHMRESGVIADDDAAFIQWAERMADVFSVNVKKDWSDLTYVKKNLQEHVGFIEETLKKIRLENTSLDDID